MTQPTPFWLVWSPTGAHPPRYQHGSMDDARSEAGRLARLHPGHAFFVLKPTIRLELPPMQMRVSVYVDDTDADDGIPF